jgi:hypothetical protein
MCVILFLYSTFARGAYRSWGRYCVVGVALLLVRKNPMISCLTVTKHTFHQFCGLYYYVRIVLLPQIGGYEIKEEVVVLDGGALTSRLVYKHKERSFGEERPLLAYPDHH